VINTYLATSKEFQPVVVTKTVNGVTETVTTGVQVVLVPKGTPLDEGTPQATDELNGEIGFFTDALTKGYWEVGVTLNTNPEEPLLSCGFIRIK